MNLISFICFTGALLAGNARAQGRIVQVSGEEAAQAALAAPEAQQQVLDAQLPGGMSPAQTTVVDSLPFVINATSCGGGVRCQPTPVRVGSEEYTSTTTSTRWATAKRNETVSVTITSYIIEVVPEETASVGVCPIIEPIMKNETTTETIEMTTTLTDWYVSYSTSTSKAFIKTSVVRDVGCYSAPVIDRSTTPIVSSRPPIGSPPPGEDDSEFTLM